MFCKSCGAPLSNDTRFCPHCGCAREMLPPVQPVTPPATPVSFADKVRATARKACASPLVLAIAICATLIQLLNLLSAGFAGNTLSVYAESYAEIGAALPDLSALLTVFSAIGMLPGILILIGLWITYGSCAGRKPRVNTGGLTMIFVVSLVQLALVCLTLLAAMFLLVLAYAGSEELLMADEDIVEAILIAVGLVLLAVFAFALIYYIKLCTSVTNLRNTLNTGVPNKRVSRFVGVMCYIGGGLMILSGIGDLASAGTVTLYGYYDEALTYTLPASFFLSGIITLLSAAVQIMLGVWIFSYRSKMAALETEERMNDFKTLSYAEPYTSPVYTPPQPVAAPESAAEETE